MHEGPRRGSWLACLGVWLLSFGLYLLYAGKLSTEEIVAGVLAAMPATVATAVFARLHQMPLPPTLSDVAQVWRIPWYMVSGTIEVFQALGKQLFTARGADSLLRAVRFDGGGDDPQSAARRALAVTYTTLTPNFIVVGIVREQELLVYHQILEGEVLTMTRRLGARP